MFRPGTTFTHRHMLDAAILVLKCFRDHKGRCHLRVRWVNRRGMDLGITERITIVKEQLSNWRELQIS